MRRTIGYPLSATAALLAIFGAGRAADAKPPVAQRAHIVAAVDAAVAAGLPGVVVYARNGSRTIVVAGGSDQLATKRAMTTSDRFRIGSVTKTFTATVVMQLVHENKLTLDDTVEQHLPGLVRNGKA